MANIEVWLYEAAVKVEQIDCTSVHSTGNLPFRIGNWKLYSDSQ